MEPKLVKNITNAYVFGNGKVSVGFGKNTVTEIPSITLAKLEIPEKIGTNLMTSEPIETEKILISFKNIEGFKIFEEMVKQVKKHLKEQSKLL